ncbi:lamin tail domain-containing protein [Leifsonia sp. ZF2019]|nr:lamin tail domain-containing protein [Leifsonia sp. ZF2019]
MRAGAAAFVVSGLAIGSLPATPAFASSDGTGVVINEAYLSGGSQGAAYKNKFIELYNSSNLSVSLKGWSVQYRAAGGDGRSAAVLHLTGKIPAKGHYLIQGGSNGSDGVELPSPDVSGRKFDPKGTTGTLILARTTEALTLPTGSVTKTSNVVDLLGYGTSNTYETEVADAPSSNKDVRSITRIDAVDTDNNKADFVLTSTITPQNATGTQR